MSSASAKQAARNALRLLFPCLAGVPILLLGFSTGPPVRRTGAPVDGGLTCTACHPSFAPANSDARGSIVIDAQPYTPGSPQIIRVTVRHPDASQWGFQLTARRMNDLTKAAGTFTVSDTVRVRCDDGRDAPCSSTTEFAEHLTPGKASGSFTFDVRWTPPADTGDVVFYAAGNAANGDGTLFGDRIYTTSKTTSPLASSPCALTARPSIRAVVSAASGQTGMASGSLLALFGTGFQATGASRAVMQGDLAGGMFPKQLACVAVEIGGVRTPLTYVQPDQINFQAPASLTLTVPANLVVVLNPGAANELRSDVFSQVPVAYVPAFFTFNGKSVAAQFAGTASIVANPAVVASGRPAAPGDLITVYGTGFGPTNPGWQAGDLPDRASFLTATPTVLMGGVVLTPSDIFYAGLVPSQISGLYQFNLRIPAGVPDGDVPISITVGGVTTQAAATVPVKR